MAIQKYFTYIAKKAKTISFKKMCYKIKYGSRFSAVSLSVKKDAHIEMIGKGGSIKIGEGFRLKHHSVISVIGGELEIGDYCFFNSNCHIVCRDKVKIGKTVSFGPNISIFDHNHKFDSEMIYGTEYATGEVVIEDGCWIGAGAIILANTHIGKGCVIGAGTVVKGDIPPHSIVTMDRALKIKPITDKNKKTED